ncbi:DUF1654 domain-containing protein [Pseudomonas aeruginosa]|uniref:DUF1654 domain-containing protein n=3 Tax=Hollowayvirus TaxID=1720324 RepID=Q5QF81_9CAUD|nr:DUF1654 domain-containing protein [Pseudomonas aeruginosa]YP_010765809.1 hypothetical protein QGM56_gp50 [Pseudomonas phage vB_PaeP_E220]YP_010765853.1 hypothetical protein QGM57_gp27 [Pseudomonas phage phiC725A]YP_164292.1 DUF1654 domain-containing protein [Pseudomonas phage F116]EAZ57597.1 hypothetical protein PA2G_00797 [Pseudomonas aeruginosa 2192]QBI82401.1 hypothetical protein [Pseudomonas phage vB_Pae_CF24a]QBI82530.1 hypothetical protein [Pseudomonas phage vB_Pae_CF69a]QBI82593.1 
MAKQKKKQEAQVLTAGEKLGLRVTQMINSPKAQELRTVTIHRLDTDADEAWEGIMEVLAETDGIDLTFNDDGSVTLRWEEQERGEQAW